MVPTVKSWLQSRVSNDIPEEFYDGVLILRDLDGDAPFTKEIGKSEAMNLAFADILVRLVTEVDLKEADLSIGIPKEPKMLLAMANSIYSRFGEDEVEFDSEPVPTVTYIGEDWP